MNPKVYQRLSSYYLFTSTDHKTQTLRRWTVYSKKSMAQDYFLSFYFISWAIINLNLFLFLFLLPWGWGWQKKKRYRLALFFLSFPEPAWDYWKLTRWRPEGEKITVGHRVEASKENKSLHQPPISLLLFTPWGWWIIEIYLNGISALIRWYHFLFRERKLFLEEKSTSSKTQRDS